MGPNFAFSARNYRNDWIGLDGKGGNLFTAYCFCSPALCFCFTWKFRRPLHQFRFQSKTHILSHSYIQNNRMLLLTFKFLKGQKRRFLTFRGNLRDYESIWDCLKSNSDRNSWTCKCYTALLPSWGENWENCRRNIFPKIVREKYSPNSSFRKSFAHFVVGGSVLSTGSKYLETANMSRTNKDCAAKNI